ncbi:MAG: ABC transporter permease [Campylobacterota bacterium]|nr:ABC transporter permease [Campylobacterota bacterium]
MKYAVIKAYFKKEMKEMVREKLIIYLYVIPILFIFLFGYGIRMEVLGTRTLIVDQDRSKLSYELAAKFEHSKYFNTDVQTISESDALKLIKQNKKDLIIFIEPGFQKLLAKGQKVHLGIFTDGSFPLRAKTIEGYAMGTIYDFFFEKFKYRLDAMKGLISINQRNLFNQAMRDEEMIIPGLIAFIYLVIPAMMAAFLVVREKEKGTIFNFYASPIQKGEYLLAKMAHIVFLQSFNIIILWLIAIYLFDLPFRGSFTLYFVSSFIYLIISASIGLLASVITSTQIVAIILVAIVTVIPGFLYSGMIMPVSSMGGGAYVIAHLYPVMYLTHLMHDVFLVGDGLDASQNILYLLILTGYAMVLFALSYLFLKKSVK